MNNDLDVVFVVDGSPASADIQTKVAAQLPDLMSVAQQCVADGVAPNLRTTIVTMENGQLLAALPAQLPGFQRPAVRLKLVLITAGDDTSALPVPDFVQQVRALKADPDNQIGVAAIVGAAATRVVQFASAFPDSVVGSVDDDIYGRALGGLCVQLGILLKPPCVPGNATECVVTEHLTAADGVQDLVIPSCADVPAGEPCWSSRADFGCFDGGQAILIDSQPTGSDPARYSLQGLISCQLPVPGT